MEPLRDSSYNLMIFGVKVNMLLAILLAALSVAMIVLIRIKKPAKLMIIKESSAEEELYEPQFAEVNDSVEEEDDSSSKQGEDDE